MDMEPEDQSKEQSQVVSETASQPDASPPHALQLVKSESWSGGAPRKRQRKDKGRLHAVRHGALARHPLDALRHLGEDPRLLRRLERQFRRDLMPSGTIANLIFDRFWSSYLRCLLAARAEARAFVTSGHDETKAARVPQLIQGDPPALIIDDDQQLLRQALAPDLLRQLLLVQRYDRHFSREMYHALALLLVLRAHGEPGLEQSITRMVGISSEGSSR